MVVATAEASVPGFLNHKTPIRYFEVVIMDRVGNRLWIGPEQAKCPLATVDLASGEVLPDPEYAQWEPMGVSRDGTLLAPTRPCVFRGTNKSELVVLDVHARQVRLHTRDHLVYGVVFSAKGTHALIEAYGGKPCLYRLDGPERVARAAKDFRLFCGDTDPLRDRFTVSAEKLNGRVYQTDLVTGDLEEVRLALRSPIGQLRYSPDGSRVFTAGKDDVVTCFDRSWEVVWRRDFTQLPDGPSGVWSSMSGLLVFPGRLGVVAGSTAANRWGTEYLLNAATGELVHQVEARQGRGLPKVEFGDSSVILFTGRVLDLATGEVGPRLWPS